MQVYIHLKHANQRTIIVTLWKQKKAPDNTNACVSARCVKHLQL